MADPDSREPDDSTAASTADAGDEQKQDDGALAARRPRRPDYDRREAGISEQRKAMGPPLKEDADEEADGAGALSVEQDEDPVDPA